MIAYRRRAPWCARTRDILYPHTLCWRLIAETTWVLHIPVPFAGTVRVTTPFEVR